MPCLPSPIQKIPPFPLGLSLSAPIPQPTIPDVPGVPCCILPTLPLPSIPDILPPGVINPAFLAIMHAGLDAIEAWADSIDFPCPRS